MIQNRMPDPDQAGGGTAVATPPPVSTPASPSPASVDPGTASNIPAPAPNAPPPSTGPRDFDAERDKVLGEVFKVDGKHQQQPREIVKPVEEAARSPDPEPPPPKPLVEGDELAQLDQMPTPKARDIQSQAKYDSDWQAIKDKYGNLVRAERAKLSKAIQEHDQKLQEFTTKLTETEQKAQKLEGYRVAIDLQANPVFIEKYEKPIEDKKMEMVAYLNSIGVPKEAINSLNNVWSDDYSLRAITKQLEGQDAVVGETFREHVVELRRMQKDHNKAVREATSKRDELIKESREGQTRKQSERETQFKQRFDQVLAMREGEGPASVPRWGFLTQMAIPPNATTDQKIAIERHNTQANKEQEEVQQLARSDSAEERMDQAVLARAFPIMINRFNSVIAERDQFAKELAAIRKSSSFSQPNNAQLKNPAPSPRKVDSSMDAGQAIDQIFGVKG